MTISTTYAPIQYNGNSVTTVFAFPYIFFEDSNLLVTLTLVSTGVDTVQVLNTDYSVTGGNGDTGSITFMSAPATGYRVTIELDLPYTQEDDYVENQAFPADTIESGFDRAAIRDQQLVNAAERSLKFPATLSGSLVGLLPQPVDGELLIWDGVTGTIGNADIADLSSTLDTIITTPVSGEVLTWNGTKWINASSAFTSATSNINMNFVYKLENMSNPFNPQDAATKAYVDSAAPILRNHIDGYQMSTAGASTTMTIGAGQAANSTNAVYITLASSLNKTTSSWAVGTGNGGLDTGTIANSTWYYFYAIRRPDTGVVDVIFSTNASTPSLPANYTQFRRIGAWKTNGSAQWESMRQYSVGSTTKTEWLVPILTVNNSSPGTSATTVALDVPTGLAMEALVTAEIKTSSGALFGLITPLDLTDSTPSSTLFNIAGDQTDSSQEMVIGTNASGQIRYRVTSGTSPIVRIVTRGFIDARVS